MRLLFLFGTLCSAILIASADIDVDEGGSYSNDILLQSQSVNVIIDNRYAYMTYEMHFENVNMEESNSLSFEIELDPNAFVSYFIAQLNGYTMIGITKEATAAQQEYDAAVDTGLNAVMVSQDHDQNTFTVSTNIEAGGTAILYITAEQFVTRRFGYYELSLSLANDYSNYWIDGIFETTSFEVSLTDLLSLSSVEVISPINIEPYSSEISHGCTDITASNTASTYCEMSLISERDSTDEIQFTLRFQTQSMLNNHQSLWDPTSATFMHIFSYESGDILPRRVVFVLDQSGSMSGTKWVNAVAATIGAISDLSPTDRFNVVLFETGITQWNDDIQRATNTQILDAVNWLNSKAVAGSTNLYDGVMTALQMISDDSKSAMAYVNQIILITDGQPTAGITDRDEIEKGILRENSALEAPIAIFGLGIGSDLDYPLVRSIATQNGGWDARIKPSDTLDDLQEYYQILQSPVLSYIDISYEAIDPSDSQTYTAQNVSETTLRGLYSGTDLVVCGTLPHFLHDDAATPELYAIVSGNAGEMGVDITERLSPTDVGQNNASSLALQRTWAHLYLDTLGDNVDYPFVDNQSASLYNEMALALALQYNLVTHWTSMIVVDYAITQQDEGTTNASNITRISQSDKNDGEEEDYDTANGLVVDDDTTDDTGISRSTSADEYGGVSPAVVIGITAGCIALVLGGVSLYVVYVRWQQGKANVATSDASPQAAERAGAQRVPTVVPDDEAIIGYDAAGTAGLNMDRISTDPQL